MATITVSAHIGTSSSWIGTGSGYDIIAYININSTREQAIVLKTTSESWNGTNVYTKSASYTANMTNNPSSVPLTFRVKGDADRFGEVTLRSYSVSYIAYSYVSVITSAQDFNLEDAFSVATNKYVSAYQDDLNIKIGSTLIKTVGNYTSGSEVFLTDSELLSAYEAIPMRLIRSR